jgi:hypothetical protein
MAAAFRDVPWQRAGDEKHCKRARQQNQKNNPGKGIKHVHNPPGNRPCQYSGRERNDRTISPALRGLQLLVAPAWSGDGKIRGPYFSVSTTFFQV